MESLHKDLPTSSTKNSSKIKKIKSGSAIGAIALSILVGVPPAANAAVYDISWQGYNGWGWSMTGQFSFSDSLLNTGVIHADALTSFSIAIFYRDPPDTSNHPPIATFNLAAPLPSYTFDFNFDTNTGKFLPNQIWNLQTYDPNQQPYPTHPSCPSRPSTGFYSVQGLEVVCSAPDWSDDIAMSSFSGNRLTATPAVPIPSAAWMMGSSLIGLTGLRRKLKNF